MVDVGEDGGGERSKHQGCSPNTGRMRRHVARNASVWMTPSAAVTAGSESTMGWRTDIVDRRGDAWTRRAGVVGRPSCR